MNVNHFIRSHLYLLKQITTLLFVYYVYCLRQCSMRNEAFLFVTLEGARPSIQVMSCHMRFMYSLLRRTKL